MFRRDIVALFSLVILAAVNQQGCQQIPRDALELKPETLRLRQLQTRRFDTTDEKMLLSAAGGVLQDLGFTIEHSEPQVGIVVASKDRSAIQPAEVVGAVLLAVLIGVVTPIDKNQKIRASLVTKPAGTDAQRTLLRATFQRIVWNTQGQVTKAESLEDPELYQQFFQKLSQAIFLHAHDL